MALEKINGLQIGYLHSKITSDHAIEHYHNACELDFFITADLHIFVRDVNYPIADGDVLYIDEDEIHKVVYSNRTDYTRYVLNVEKDFLAGHVSHAAVCDVFAGLSRKGCRRAHLSADQYLEISLLFEMLNKQAKAAGDGANLTAVSALAFVLLYKISRLLQDKSEERAGSKETYAQKIIRYIDQNYPNKIGLATLAAEFHLTECYISHLFKEITGLSISSYLQYRRIIEAQKRLKSRDAAIVSVCYECGFTSLPHFYKVFRRITGTTPKAFAKNTR